MTHNPADLEEPDVDVVLPNLNRRFSGITSTLIQVAPHHAPDLKIATVGYPMPLSAPHLSWTQLLRLAKRPTKSGYPRIFHARRNIEMCAGLLLNWIFRCRFHLIFTSVAQRHHSAFTRFLYRRMDTLLSTSPRSASFLKREPDAIIPHGIDASAYTPAIDRRDAWREGGLPGDRGVGIFGRIRPQKGVREFVLALCRVLPKHPDVTAVLVGETTPAFRSFEQEMRQIIAEHGLTTRFVWLGKRPFHEIPIWFRRMSVVTAVSHVEGFGLTCLEAMASGVPVVVSRAGAFEMMIRDGVEGRIVPCGESESLAAALEDLLGDSDRLETLGKAARNRVLEAFTVQHEATALNDLYQRVRKTGHKPA